MVVFRTGLCWAVKWPDPVWSYGEAYPEGGGIGPWGVYGEPREGDMGCSVLITFWEWLRLWVYVGRCSGEPYAYDDAAEDEYGELDP